MDHPSSKLLAKRAAKYLAQKSRQEIRRLAGRRRIPTRQCKRRLLRASKDWQKWEIALVGTAPDEEIARQTGRTRLAVSCKRRQFNIPNFVGRPNDWTPEEDRLLGTNADPVIAKKLGRSAAIVFERRKFLGIPSGNPKQRFWTKLELNLLGRFSDREVARR